VARLEVSAPIGCRRRFVAGLAAIALVAVLLGCTSEANGRHALEVVESALRSAAIALDDALTEHRVYPTGADTPLDEVLSGFSAEHDAVVLLVWSSENAFCLEGTKDEITAWYDSTGGGLTGTSCR
jgi:hypothetical protein